MTDHQQARLDHAHDVVIVTGAHPRAETHDRPVAYALGERCASWLSGRDEDSRGVLVCSDLWYMNDASLRSHPTIAIGGPSVNALTAYLADKLESVFVVEGVLIVQADLDFQEMSAACWGVDAPSTDAAVNAFAEKYLDAFMQAAVGTGR